MKFNSPKSKPPKAVNVKMPHLVGQFKQAPGLAEREGDVLHKALGIDQKSDIHPMALSALAQYHPDPKVQKLAAFKLKGIYKP